MPTVLFDLDGTLHDRLAGLRAFAENHAQLLGVAVNAREHFVERYIQLDANGKIWKDRVYSQLQQEFESSTWPSTDLLVEYYIREFPRFAVEIPGATNLLQMLSNRRVQLGIVTNGRSDLQRSVIDTLGFNRFTSTIIVSEEIGYRKPQREIFELALASLAATPQESIIVGDDPVADIEGALKLGIFPVAFKCSSADLTVVAHDMEGVGNAILKHIHGAD